MDLNLNADDFTLFGLPRQFALSRDDLDARWKQLQREVHPDRFAAQGAAAQRVAMQWSVRINEAYQRLKDPIRRAAYLCGLLGAPVEGDSNTAMPTDFLVQQMTWREALDDAGSDADRQSLREQVEQARMRALSALEWLLDEKGDAAAAAAQVRALMFIERFARDVEAASGH